jgi:hypothetical protein
MSARQKYIDDHVAAKAQAWIVTNNQPHPGGYPGAGAPPRARQQPSPQHLATWADEARRSAARPKE